MQLSGKNAFINQLLAGMLVVFVLGGSAGLGAVWLRHQISLTARATLELEQKLARVERRLAATNTFVAAEQSPEALARRNRDMRLGLALPRRENVHHVAVSVEERLATRRNRELFNGDRVLPVPAADLPVPAAGLGPGLTDAPAGPASLYIDTTPTGGGTTPARRQ
jgi:hypothetical protein